MTTPINEAITAALSQPLIESGKPLQSESAPQTERLSQSLIDRLWLKMAELYGQRWTASFGVSADQSHAWAAALAGLTGQQLATGLAVLARSADEQLRRWPPSAPEFRALCEQRSPDAFGLPDVEVAFREACRNAHPAMANAQRWSHSAVFHAASESGFYNLTTLRMADARRLFERNYAIACRMVMDGQTLREIPKALPEKATAPRTEQVARDALDNLKRVLRGAA